MNVIEFNRVWKKFKRGEKLNSIRDFLPALFKKTLSGNGALKKEEFWALQNISFEIKKGEVIGLIGSNGAGKSTALKLLAGIIKPNQGEVQIKGRLSALIEVTAGFHPELTGRENVYLNGTIIGMRKKEIDQKFDEIVEFSGISEFIDTPVKRYSSGMYSRLGFSIASHMEPDILLVDEVLSVGDISFQAKCAQKMRELLNSGTTIILVSHNLTLVQNLCKRVIFLDKGEIRKEGSPEEVIPYYENIVYKKREEEIKNQAATSDYKVKIKEEPPVVISKVDFYGEGDKPKGNFRIGEQISVEVQFESKALIDNPVFSLDIIRADDILCCSSNTKENGSIISKIEGKGNINIHLGNINLAPGIYIAKISILDKDMIYTYTMRKRDIFRIELDDKHKQAMGIFLPKVEWRKQEC